jgi:5-histidylcysteine sulfoxide synthase
MSFALESIAPTKARTFGLKPRFESQWMPEHVEESMSEEDVLLRKTNTIVLTGSDVEAKREEIRQYFHRTFTIYEKLFEVLTDKAFYMRADRLRHPLIFYYGHTATFFLNKMTIAGLVKERINPHYESMFAVGVDEMSWDDLLPESFDWPSVADVKAYRDKAREVVDQAIRSLPLTLPISWNDPFWCFLMGIEHERIHLETSTVLIRQLPLSVLKPMSFWNRCPQYSSEAPENEWLPVMHESQLVSLGKPFESPLYGWDNEYGTQTSMVAPFKASRYLVTNKEYLEFVEDGGYAKQQYWTEEGWRWANFRRAEKASHPLFWVPVLEEIPNVKQRISSALLGTGFEALDSDSVSDSSSSVGEARDAPGFRLTYRFRTMLEEMEMPWDWPVETNYLEAKAFCNWKSAKTGMAVRLPMEDEYEVLRSEVDGDHPYWNRAPGNLNLEYYCSSTPVTAFPPSPNGFYDVVGNVW